MTFVKVAVPVGTDIVPVERGLSLVMVDRSPSSKVESPLRTIPAGISQVLPPATFAVPAPITRLAGNAVSTVQFAGNPKMKLFLPPTSASGFGSVISTEPSKALTSSNMYCAISEVPSSNSFPLPASFLNLKPAAVVNKIEERVSVNIRMKRRMSLINDTQCYVYRYRFSHQIGV